MVFYGLFSVKAVEVIVLYGLLGCVTQMIYNFEPAVFQC